MAWLRNRKRSSFFTPHVETLEGRTVPTAVLTGTSLTMTGVNIRIIDLGTDSASVTNAITVTSDGAMQTFSGAVTSITINGKPGRDNVVYALGGSREPLTGAPLGAPTFLVTRAQRMVTANLNSSARDRFTLFFQAQQTFVGANYKFTVNGGAKGNNYGVRSNGLILDATSVLDLNLLGAAGSDNITVNLVDTAVSPALSPGFTGETPPPPGSAAGRNGSLFVDVNGLGGNDQLFANVAVTNDSQGIVVGDVIGGFGNDLLGLIVNLPPPPSTVAMLTGFQPPQTILLLAGGVGNDAGINTTNVKTTGLQSDLLVL